jgi:hypothetical protein
MADDGTRPGPAHTWLDQEAGPVVRPYTMTGGRVDASARGLDMLTYVEAVPAGGAGLTHLQPEHRAILAFAATPASIVDIAARLKLPIGVTRVLIGDLLQQHLLSTLDPEAATDPGNQRILQAVIDGLQAL